ncbi:MAG: 6-phosphogluconolactonase [Alphaproteobacteria bacterium]|nr:6-phosphogluconolactonase [Alphaproteobacteria bacterium]
MPKVHVSATADESARQAAELVAALSERAVRDRGRFAVALSGGSTPRRLHAVLASEEYRQRISWPHWRIFWGDERAVRPDHDESNYRMARETLLDHVALSQAHVHRIPTEFDPARAASEYEQTIRQALHGDIPTFDLILLGMGDDGHTASLFPGSEALQEDKRLVTADRITFTLPLINRAAAVAFLVEGAHKANMVQHVLQAEPGEEPLPASLVQPADGELHWFLDSSAAEQLTGI